MIGRIASRVTTAVVTLPLVCAAALVFAVAAVQAQMTRNATSRSAVTAFSDCTLVIGGASWNLPTAGGSISGDKYTVKARDMSCSSASTWVTKLTNQHNPGIGQTIKGPGGFKCTSFTTPASGAKLVASGVCTHPPHNDPFFGWGPKPSGH